MSKTKEVSSQRLAEAHKSQKTKSLSFILSRFLFFIIVIVFVCVTITVNSIIKNILHNNAQKDVQKLAQHNASVVETLMENVYDREQVISGALTSATVTLQDAATRRSYTEDLLLREKQKMPQVLSLFFYSEPGITDSVGASGYAVEVTNGGVSKKLDYATYSKYSFYQNMPSVMAAMIADPYEKQIDGQTYKIINVCVPVLGRDGSFIGLVGADIDVNFINNAEYDSGGYETFVSSILCGHLTNITHSTSPELVGRKFVETSQSANPDVIVDAVTNATPLTFQDKNKDGSTSFASYVPFFVGNSKVPWLSGIRINNSEIKGIITSSILQIVAVCVVGGAVLVVLAYLTIKKSLQPVAGIMEVAKQIENGNLHSELCYSSDNEIGALAKTFIGTQNTLKTYILDIQRVLTEMANGNMDVSVDIDYCGDFLPIKESMQNIAQKLNDTLIEIYRVSDQVADSSRMVSQTSSTLAQGANEQSASVEEFARTMELLSTQVQENAKDAQTVNLATNATGEELNASSSKVQNLVAAMEEMNKASAQISKIVKTIDDIAFQTNILALNAAVEAARAGEAGKGFAVVADEVRNLASKSAAAAKDTTELIQNSIRSVSAGVRIAADTGVAMEKVTAGSQKVVSLVQHIAESSTMQASAIEDTTHSMEQISNVVMANSATAEESASSADELSQQSEALRKLVGRFKLKTEQHKPSAMEWNTLSAPPAMEWNTLLTPSTTEWNIPPQPPTKY